MTATLDKKEIDQLREDLEEGMAMLKTLAECSCLALDHGDVDSNFTFGLSRLFDAAFQRLDGTEAALRKISGGAEKMDRAQAEEWARDKLTFLQDEQRGAVQSKKK
ncbi:hypothetical protein SAMN05880590_102722 [Rhizobium sp. RU35A]|uniref:hypothetical protein n=1 Tax=Rhizobium sp. RU35A TaxID=1907414 RepID=UPI00095477CD|nr:hypothetical protein [Rhizobium sp. RU35A]SIQ23549.1 hypothetical protein SAMN05880590_102722 [Rhizobium sp. RU35A]